MENLWVCGTVFRLKEGFRLGGSLLHKLEHYDVKGNALIWFKNCITKRAQKVNYGEKLYI